MKIEAALKKGFALSFEFFPPKTPEAEAELFQHLAQLKTFSPDYVSVTYGAGGSTRHTTRDVVLRMHREEGLTVMAHLTSVGHQKAEITGLLEAYKAAGIKNILALRGDPPANGTEVGPGDFAYGADLIRFIRDTQGEAFSIGGPAFPERHPLSPNMSWEMKHFKEKVEAGMSFAVTQMFFDNRYYEDFLEECGKFGISIPIIPGIMPVTNFTQIKKFAELSRATIPARLVERLQAVEHDKEEVLKIGIDHAVKQCEGLRALGVPGLHFFTLNKAPVTIQILEALGFKPRA